MSVISSIYAGTPDDMRKRVQRHRELGYRGHSVKIGANETDGGAKLDAERIRASLADAKYGEYFIVDANGGLGLEHALRLLRLVPKHLDFVLEAPCNLQRTSCLKISTPKYRYFVTNPPLTTSAFYKLLSTKPLMASA